MAQTRESVPWAWLDQGWATHTKIELSTHKLVFVIGQLLDLCGSEAPIKISVDV